MTYSFFNLLSTLFVFLCDCFEIFKEYIHIFIVIPDFQTKTKELIKIKSSFSATASLTLLKISIPDSFFVLSIKD